MIDRVRLVRFKRFADHTFDVSGRTVVLAGPNNSGKTTLFHAISAWNLALTRWKAELGAKKSRKKRLGIVLDEFTALPLREMNLLWLNRHTARRTPDQKQPKPAPVYVELSRDLGRTVGSVSLTFEFLYANEKLVYVRPVKSPEDPSHVEKLPPELEDLAIVHVPAFSGIGTQEERRSPGAQNKVVGEGKPGDIVRNLLLEVHDRQDPRAWESLVADVGRLFKCLLLPPEFSDARPYIVAEYRPETAADDLAAARRKGGPKLDIANAGSGFHQVLLLLSFLYSREGAVLLLDEPDAHLHVILQREVFDHLRTLAMKRGSQIVVATHSEVLLNDARPDQIVSFVGPAPRRLSDPREKDRVREAMRRLSALDLLQVDHVGAVLYAEDESDLKILREWAAVLGHPARRFLDASYFVPLRGRGNLGEARRHFECLRMVDRQVRGVCLVDRDQDETDEMPQGPVGLAMQKWRRYEIESYLLMPEAMRRFVREGVSDQREVDEQIVSDGIFKLLPRETDFLGDHRVLRDLKASEAIVEILSGTCKPLQKPDLYMLAASMRPEEIHPEVVEKLDAIAQILPAVSPMIEANLAPADPTGVVEDEAEEEDDEPR